MLTILKLVILLVMLITSIGTAGIMFLVYYFLIQFFSPAEEFWYWLWRWE